MSAVQQNSRIPQVVWMGIVLQSQGHRSHGSEVEMAIVSVSGNLSMNLITSANASSCQNSRVYSWIICPALSIKDPSIIKKIPVWNNSVALDNAVNAVFTCSARWVFFGNHDRYQRNITRSHQCWRDTLLPPSNWSNSLLFPHSSTNDFFEISSIKLRESVLHPSSSEVGK